MCINFRRKMALFLAGCLVLGSVSLNSVNVRASQDVSGGDVSAEVPDDGRASAVGTEEENPGSVSADAAGTEEENPDSVSADAAGTEEENPGSVSADAAGTDEENRNSGNADAAGTEEENPGSVSADAAGTEEENRDSVSADASGAEEDNPGSDSTDVAGMEEENPDGDTANVAGLEEAAPESGIVKSYMAADLKAYGRWGGDVQLTEGGKMVFKFEKQYEEYCLDLPETLDMSNCESITIRTADQKGVLCFKVYDSEKNELKPYYGNSGQEEYTFTPDFAGSAACIGVMSNNEIDTHPFTAQIVSIEFKMKEAQEPEPEPGPETDKVYEAAKLKAYGRWGGDVEPTEDGRMVFTFTEQWNEYCLDLPETLDMSNCERITIRTADQGGELCFKVYDGEKNELKPYYGNSGQNEYTFTPDFKGYAATIGVMANNAKDIYPYTAEIVSIEFKMKEGSGEIQLGDNLIQNPNFADADNLSVWNAQQGGSTITAEVSEEDIIDGIKTYGKITNRDSNYNCFAQDITDVIQKNKEYEYTFYIKLDEADYAGTSEEMRTVAMAPFIVSDGNANYVCNLVGDREKVLEPGVWTKFTGIFTPSWTGELNQVVVRLLEQGTEYGAGPGVKGTYYATGVELRERIVPEKKIQEDVPDLKDAITGEMGDDFIVGVSIVNSELSDDLLMQLVTKHFNAITIGNELKPDSMFGYNSKCPGTEKATINGQEIDVPIMDYSRAEMTLNAIFDWNQEHPEDKISVRGHVLVWHEQTPEWFFHEDYDETKADVDKDTMNLRMEWYIKTMAEHFTGEGSKYKGMFYGWDVVNEAVGSSTYRTDEENSSWWRIYKSNEYILNAFRYANKYFPKDVELYYNDFNEWFPDKVKGIVRLLQDVKGADGTRIDGMGMQGHYQTDVIPTGEDFEKAARAYCDVVGQVQITEFDMAASSQYDGTAATLDAEYERQASRYNEIYTAVRRLKKDGYKVGNITFWGVIDKNSWLQNANSAGGGSDGTRKQCPLLFEDGYQVKPAYWIFVNPGEIKPVICSLPVVQSVDSSFDAGIEQTYAFGDTAVSFVPVWDENGISVRVKVSDSTEDAGDKVTLYLADAEGKTIQAECLRKDAEKTGDGYIAVVKKELDKALLKPSSEVKLDIVVTNGEEKGAYNDTTFSQDKHNDYFAVATLKSGTAIMKGTAEVDGVKESIWDSAAAVPLDIYVGDAKAKAEVSLLWDEDCLYVYAVVEDSVLDKSASAEHEQDSLEIFVDENNHKSAEYEEDDKQYRINYENEQSFNGPKCNKDNIESAAKVTEEGYVIEAALKWTDIKPEAGTVIGLELQINDGEEGRRLGTVSWSDRSGMGWSAPEVFGSAVLKDSEDPSTEPTTEPSADPSTEPTTDPSTDPTTEPTTKPTAEPTAGPTTEPTTEPGTKPTTAPTTEPGTEPTAAPTTEPGTEPTAAPTTEPGAEPTTAPTTEPGAEPTTEPTTEPGAEPTTEPTTEPGAEPTTAPTTEPTTVPTSEPAPKPTAVPDTEIPFIKDEADKSGWEVIKEQAVGASEGEQIAVNMNGASIVPGSVFGSIKGKNVTITFDMGNGIIWSVNGRDVTADHVSDINLSVQIGITAIPQDIVDSVARGRQAIQISLAHNGEFGFSAVLMINLNPDNAGLYATLFYYNKDAGRLELMTAARIQEDGIAKLKFTHASDYVIVIGDEVREESSGGSGSDTGSGSQGEQVQSPKTGETDTIVMGANPEQIQREGNGLNLIWLFLIGAVVAAVTGMITFLIYKKAEK